MSNWPGDCSQLVQQQQQQQQAMANNYQQNYNPAISHAGMTMTMNPMTATIKREPMPYSSSCSGNSAPNNYGGPVPQMQPRTSVSAMTQQQQQPRPQQQQPRPQQQQTSNEAMYYNYNNAQANNVARMYQNAVGSQQVNNMSYQNQSNNPNIRLYQSSSSSPGGQAVHYQRTSSNNSNVNIQFQNQATQQQQQQQQPTNNITIRYQNPTQNISGIRYQPSVSQQNVHYVQQQPTNSAAALQIVNQLRQQHGNKQFIQELRNPSLTALLFGKGNQVPGQNANFGQPNQNYNNNQQNVNLNVHSMTQKAKQAQPPPYPNNSQRPYPPVNQQGMQYSNKRQILPQPEKKNQFLNQPQMMPTLNQLLQANPFALNANKGPVNHQQQQQQQQQYTQPSPNVYRLHPSMAPAPNVTVQMYNPTQNTYSMNTNPPKVPTTSMPPPAMNTMGNYAETPSSFSMWHKPSQWNTTSETYPETQQQQQTKPQPTPPQNDPDQNLGGLPSVTDKAIVPTTVMSNTFPTTYLDGSGTGSTNVSLQQLHPQPTSSDSTSSSSSYMSNNMSMPPLSSSSATTTTTSSSSTSSSSAPIQTDKDASLSDKMNIAEDLQLPAIDDLSNIVRQIIDDCWADNDFDHRTFDSPELILGINADCKTSQNYNTDKDGKATTKYIQLSSNKQSNRTKDIPNDMQVMKDLETIPMGNTTDPNLRKASTKETEKEPEEECMSDITESDLRSLLISNDHLPVVLVGTCGPELVIEMVDNNSQDLIKQLAEVKG